MQVLQVDAGREMRGGQRQVMHLIGGLRQRGVEAPLLARPHSPLFGAAKEAGFPVEPLTFRSLSRGAHDAGLVHAHDARAHTLASLVCGARVVVSRRVAFPIGSSWKYRRARHYVAVSEHVRRVLEDSGVPSAAITVVHDGVPIPAHPAQGSRVVVPQSFDTRKCVALALSACKRAGLEPLVSTDLEKDLATASLLLYLSESEGLGSAALLALAFGVPVIASRVGGLPEAVENGITGLLVDNDVSSVSNAIRELLNDEIRRGAMARRAREAAAARFAVDRMVEATLEVYRRT